MSDEALMERCEAYLEGALSGAEARRFERELTLEENAAVFRQVLLMRQLLAELPPDQAPEELVRQLEEALEVDPGAQRRRTRLLRVRAALDGLSWAVKGPAQAFGTGSQAAAAAAPTAAGLSTMRYALGPLAQQREAPATPKKPLWRRVLARSLRRRKKE